jgi:CxxC motif-containing protein (DUF1111 family)
VRIWPRPPRAASLSAGRRAAASVLRAAVLYVPAATLGLACADAERGLLEAGEQLPGGEGTNETLFGTNAFLPPASNATLENRRLFFGGNAFFNQAWTAVPSSNTARDGLGPLYNSRSCSGCHAKDGRGRPPLADEEGFVSMLLRLSVDGSDGEPMPEPNYGGQLQPFGVEGVPGEGTPSVSYETISGQYADGEPYELLRPSYAVAELALGPLHGAVRISPRVAPAMIGLGLLEAISEERLLSLADPDDADGDGVSGRVNRVPDVEAGELAIGRFGWKAEQPNVRQQSAGAFLGDLGITSSLFPDEECSPAQLECQASPSGGDPELSDELLESVQRYGQLLAVPARQRYQEPEVLRGKGIFAEVGCGGCHTPSHHTSEEAELTELQGQLIWPYTDLLLHDLGEELSDHRPSFAADGAEWRTPPLWGLGFYPTVNDHDRLLHDGRARGVAEAVLWHGGEAKNARDAFVELPADDRRDLIAFVESL